MNYSLNHRGFVDPGAEILVAVEAAADEVRVYSTRPMWGGAETHNTVFSTELSSDYGTHVGGEYRAGGFGIRNGIIRKL